MRADQLLAQPVQRVEPAGVNPEPARLVLWGIHGGNEFVIGVQLGDALLTRAPGEEVEALRHRAARAVAPTHALRDPTGAAIGYFVYAGLPPDHCAAAALEQRRAPWGR